MHSLKTLTHDFLYSAVTWIVCATYILTIHSLTTVPLALPTLSRHQATICHCSASFDNSHDKVGPTTENKNTSNSSNKFIKKSVNLGLLTTAPGLRLLVLLFCVVDVLMTRCSFNVLEILIKPYYVHEWTPPFAWTPFPPFQSFCSQSFHMTWTMLKRSWGKTFL